MRKIMTLVMGIVTNYLVAQQENVGYIVECNIETNVEYISYTPPLRINKVEHQNQIDYSKIEGLLQSYLSANNLQWAKSEYIDENDPIVRDEEHFQAVKKSSIEDYIQLETAYIFNYQTKKYAFVKYSLIFEKMPFPWTNLMVLENRNNRWYISKLINQNQILLFLGNLSNESIINILNKDEKDKEIKSLIDKVFIENKLSMTKVSLLVDDFDDNLKRKFYDKRILDEEAEFRNGTLNAQKQIIKTSVLHPFLIEGFRINEYDSKDKNILKSEKSVEKYSNTPEFLLLNPNTPTDFLSKIEINFGDGKKYFYIKYKQNKSNVSIIEESNGNFIFTEKEEIKGLRELFLKYEASYLENLFNNPKKEYLGNSGGVNINELIRYIEKQ